MSTETARWLNTMTLIGNTDHRGTAWHYRAELQGAEPNHYSGPVPVADVERRLFGWDAVELPVYVRIPATVEDMDGIDDTGRPYRYLLREERKNIATSDDFSDLGMFKQGYRPHQYREWLLHTVAMILDSELGISSAGLLRNRSVAWVEVSVPESIITPDGVEFRPNLLATTSFDGSIATTFKRTATMVVCDNTRELALAERGQTYKAKHSKYSGFKIAEAREALALVHTMADEFAAEVATLLDWPVSDSQWAGLLEDMIPARGGQAATTRALKRRDDLNRMYRYDSRVNPWHGTAFGVVQAFNTFNHHERPTARNTNRAERNMLDAITGATATEDTKVLTALRTLTR